MEQHNVPELTGARLKMVREMIVINSLISIEIYELLFNNNSYISIVIKLIINNFKTKKSAYNSAAYN